MADLRNHPRGDTVDLDMVAGVVIMVVVVVVVTEVAEDGMMDVMTEGSCHIIRYFALHFTSLYPIVLRSPRRRSYSRSRSRSRSRERRHKSYSRSRSRSRSRSKSPADEQNAKRWVSFDQA